MNDMHESTNDRLNLYLKELRQIEGWNAWEDFAFYKSTELKYYKGTMTPEQFTYWLQGFIELNHGKPPSPEQWVMIKDHISTVFHKVTPNYTFPEIIC